ncbi:hypothetical protein SAMN05216354_1638 [Xylanibacter ruminicola]|uniref:Uncharacterized protein n=1 Tax=Xylanibacter ruminicola TaxID=839 RepID=A0A1H5UYN2_XYLRU|nr:hypothetical protein SAMN05216354_1638 [Xylanibacter ruminicola]
MNCTPIDLTILSLIFQFNSLSISSMASSMSDISNSAPYLASLMSIKVVRSRISGSDLLMDSRILSIFLLLITTSFAQLLISLSFIIAFSFFLSIFMYFLFLVQIYSKGAPYWGTPIEKMKIMMYYLNLLVCIFTILIYKTTCNFVRYLIVCLSVKIFISISN